MAAYQVIEQQYRQYPGQCLWQENAKRREAENLGAGRLQPEAQRRLVNAYKTTWIKGDKEEVMPTVEHAPDRSGIIKVAEAVLSQLVKVHVDRNEHDTGQPQSPPERRPAVFALHLQLFWPVFDRSYGCIYHNNT